MSSRVRELADRQAQLQQRCDAQRAAIAYEVASIENRFGAVDRGVVFVRSVLLHPATLIVGSAALLFIGRLRGLGLLGRVLLLVTAARRLAIAAKQL